MWYFTLKIIRDVIDVHSGELAKLWQEEREEDKAKTSQHSHRYSKDDSGDEGDIPHHFTQIQSAQFTSP